MCSTTSQKVSQIIKINMAFLCLQESELYGLLATAKSLQIKGLTDAEDNGGNEPARTAAPPQQPRDELYKKRSSRKTGGQFTWPKYLPENLPENLPEKTSHQKVTIKKSNWIFGKILGKIFWPCELTSCSVNCMSHSHMCYTYTYVEQNTSVIPLSRYRIRREVG